VGLLAIHGRREWDLRDIVTVEQTIGKCRIRFLGFDEFIDGVDVLNHGHNATCQHKQACDYGENANDIQADEYI